MSDAGDTHWRIERANRMAVIIDAEAYFAAAREALLKATQRIMLVGWDFDARIDLHVADRLPDEPAQIGDRIDLLDVQIHQARHGQAPCATVRDSAP